MITRSFPTSRFFALSLALVTAPVLSQAQTPAAPDTNAAPAAPAAPTPAPPAPAPTAAPADPGTATTTEHPDTYTVAQGDSLWTIAHKNGTTVVKLRKLNNLKKG